MKNFNFYFFQVLPWLLSAITITSMWLAGNKDKRAWILGLINQVGWTLFIFHTEAWGLIPTVIFLTFIYSRNLIKWIEQELQDTASRSS